MKYNMRFMKILVIDDEFSLLRLVQIMLQKKGHEVLAVLSSAEARNMLLNKGPFNLLILDLMMPKESGFSFIEWLDAQGDGLKKIPVIVNTAKNLSDEEGKFLRDRNIKVVMKGMHYGESLIMEVEDTLKKAAVQPQ